MSDRTRIRREPERAREDRADLDAVLDAGYIAHVGIVDDGQPFVMPVAYARRGDSIVMHGSTGSRLFRALASGAPACATVTLLDGFVYARSAFNSSMNYRSAVILGRATRLEGDDETDSLRVLTEHLLPGRWQEIRQPNRKERNATMTIALPLDEWSVKMRTGGPNDEPEDIVTAPWSQIWAGHVPLTSHFGAPIPDAVLSDSVPVPGWIAHRSAP